jgi:hypothetical protein
MLIGDKLIRPADDNTPIPLLPDAYRPLVSTKDYTVGLTNNSRSVLVVHADATVHELVHSTQAIRSIAISGSRLAYSVQVVKGGAVTSNLFLVSLPDGKLVQRLDGVPSSGPVGFSGHQVVLSVGDGAESSIGSWMLKTNSYQPWPQSAGDVPLDVVGGVALVAEGDFSCAAVTEIASLHQRFSSCSPGGSNAEIERYGLLSPDGTRYTGIRYAIDKPHEGWPVVADATTGKVDDRLHKAFTAAGLVVDALMAPAAAWEDASHLIVVGVTDQQRKLVVRCDVDAATCEIAQDTGDPPVDAVQLVKPVY